MKKEKFVIEYDLKSVSPTLLWTYIGSANGLADWFADSVICDGKEYTFIWNKTPQKAVQTAVRTGFYIRFHWEEDGAEKTYFELRIATSELTGSTVLTITDFATPDEQASSRELWDTQIDDLRRTLGL
mgnify:FL=1